MCNQRNNQGFPRPVSLRRFFTDGFSGSGVLDAAGDCRKPDARHYVDPICQNVTGGNQNGAIMD